MTLREEILRSGLDYKGHTFWEDYAKINILKNFKKDYEILGEDYVEIYSALFGEDSTSLFENIYDNREMLLEDSAQRILDALNKPGSTWGLTNRMKNTTLDASIQSSLQNQGISGGLAQIGAGATGFLGKIGALLSQGFTWVKGLLTQGIAWIASNPIAKIAAPLIALAGSAVMAIKLINKVRAKKKMKPLSSSEQAALQRISEKDREKIEEYKKAMKK